MEDQWESAVSDQDLLPHCRDCLLSNKQVVHEWNATELENWELAIYP